MTERLLICTDLDRTLIPNGPQPESGVARQRFSSLVARPGVVLAYVSGRHRALIEAAISTYHLPQPDFVIGDVGTTIYHVGAAQAWQHLQAWQDSIASDWAGKSHAELMLLLNDLAELRAQEQSKQNVNKLSYYVPLDCKIDTLEAGIRRRLEAVGVQANLIWSVDEPDGTGLLDILPAAASKYHAIKALMKLYGFDYADTVFCGDSGNDIEVLVSPIASVLVANSQHEVKALAKRLAEEKGLGEQLYIAQGGFMGMNGNYSAGMLEGIAHYHPYTVDWMALGEAGHKA